MRVNNFKHNMIIRLFNMRMIQHSYEANILSHTQTAVFPGEQERLGGG